jgi:peptidyl-prolyl cis-trans isomerase C
LDSDSSTVEQPRGRTSRASLRVRLSSALARFFGDSLIQFLLIGLALFLGYTLLHRGQSTVAPSHQIALTLDELRAMELIFQSQWQRQPTVEEFNGMVENKIQEEILYREGLAMGLDKDDTIVKRRMAQKVQFLAEDVAAAHEPATQELKTWFARNTEKFALPSRVTFRHVFFGFDKRGQNARKDAAAALQKLAGQPQNSPLAAASADAFMFEDYYADRTAEQLAKEFGPAFALGMFTLKPGAWTGPLESGYGWHLVFIDSIIPGRIPEFEEVEPDVHTAWLAAQKAQAWQAAYARMRARYTVLLPAAPPESAASAPSASGEPPRKELLPPEASPQ